jgi:LAS superfamily LD-carboxypeptidase LdcB
VLTRDLLVGKSLECLSPLSDARISVHREMLAPFLRLQSAAFAAGFDLQAASGFRSFESQLGIWNAKALGKRPILDERGLPLSLEKLSMKERVFSILRWSALPGASRHHWGTDVDVYDRAAMPEGYSLCLTPEEVAPAGIFGPLHEWLDEKLHLYGFFRPYDVDRGGVLPERWHLSYRPISAEFESALSFELIEEVILGCEMELKESVLNHLDEIYRQFVKNISLG